MAGNLANLTLAQIRAKVADLEKRITRASGRPRARARRAPPRRSPPPPPARVGDTDRLIASPLLLPALIAESAALLEASKGAVVAADVNRCNVLLASITREQAKKLASLVPLTPDKFMARLQAAFSSGGEGVDWRAFGVEASAFFREPPVAHGVYHMCGARGGRGRARGGARRGAR